MFARISRRAERNAWRAALVVSAVASGLTPWEAIADLIENAGVSSDGIVLMVVVAGQTLPACLGVLLALTLIDRGWVPINTLGRVAIFAGIFMATAAVTEP